jgi:heat shock protein HtpX
MGEHNIFKTALLLTTLTVLLVVFGGILGGNAGMLLALLLALGMNFSTYWFSDRMALAMAGAKEVSERDAPELHRLVERLALQARMPKPRVHLVDTPTPNAFATGRDPAHGAVAVTRGLLATLDRDELAAVLAHELAHVKNHDTLVATIAATAAGAITMLANMAHWAILFGGMGREDRGADVGGIAGLGSALLMTILAPLAATVIQLAISREREYGADAVGARILGDPLPLARALAKMNRANQTRPMVVNPALAHQFTVQPLRGGGLAGLFSTHPPMEQRIARLKEMALRPTVYQD